MRIKVFLQFNLAMYSKASMLHSPSSFPEGTHSLIAVPQGLDAINYFAQGFVTTNDLGLLNHGKHRSKFIHYPYFQD